MRSLRRGALRAARLDAPASAALNAGMVDYTHRHIVIPFHYRGERPVEQRGKTSGSSIASLRGSLNRRGPEPSRSSCIKPP